MSYYISKTVAIDFDSAIAAITASLKEQGFGIITEIDMSATLKNKIDKDIPPYKILGACNPGYAYQAVINEPQVGVMLPCNVIVRQVENNQVEIAAIDPLASMMAIENDKLHGFAQEVKDKLTIAVNAV
ncbi:MAG: DUF302 domain-containing protein [Salibacteraceae bacterium]